MGYHFFLQGIFLTQGLNLGLLYSRQILYCLSNQGTPKSRISPLKEEHCSYNPGNYWIRVMVVKRTFKKYLPLESGFKKDLEGAGGEGGRRGGSGWGRHVNPRPFHFNVWQNSLQKKKKERKMLLIESNKKKKNVFSLVIKHLWCSICDVLEVHLWWTAGLRRAEFGKLPKSWGKTLQLLAIRYHSIMVLTHLETTVRGGFSQWPWL